MQKNKVLIIAGPTGVGKTQISIELAKKFNGEIISSDSMQIYKGMDIGTAKITQAEMQGIPHHLIDVISPWENFSVADFKECANRLIQKISASKKLPIVAGGTGLYINTLLYEMDFNAANVDIAYREKMWNFYHQYGQDALYEKLLQVDENTKIEKENIKRVIRALEIHKTQGSIKPFEAMKRREDIDPVLIVLTRDREELYRNINLRVDQMIENGLIEEVRKFYEQGLDENYQSMKAIGYLQLIKYFKGIYTREEAIEKIKQESRKYAKRQITWFKRYENAVWIDLSKIPLKQAINTVNL